MSKGSKLPGFQKGHPIHAASLNAIRDAVAAILHGQRGGAVRKIGDHVSIETPLGQAQAQRAIVRRFRVNSESGDYLTCRHYNPEANGGAGVEGSKDVYVAKPYALRRVPFDGNTITYPNAQAIDYTYAQDYEREADDGVDTETQVMTPRYWVDEEILAVRGIAGVTGVADVGGVHVVWEDLNGCGRHWARDES